MRHVTVRTRRCERAEVVALLAAFLLSATSAASARTFTVAPGGNLQQVLNQAEAGDVILLENGGVYSGNFVLPARDGEGAPIVVRPARVDELPGPGGRITPTAAPHMPKLSSPNGHPAVRTAPRARGWRLELLELTALPGGSGEILALGDGSSNQRQLDLVPRDLTVDRCYIHGAPDAAQRRCVGLNSGAAVVTGSHISECKAVGEDSQAIAGWNGPGPYTISNNYLAGAGENIMFGGADPAIDGLVPSDITISGNTIEKPLEWRNSRWQIKNLLELKNARRVTITDNIIRHNWKAAQAGYAILLTVRNQDGRCPWCEVSAVTIERNRISGIAGGISILGHDDQHPSRQTHDVTIRQNLITDLNSRSWGGRGYFLLLLGGPRDIVVSQNTVIQPAAAGLIQVEGPPIHGFVFAGNIARHSEFGIIGTDRGPGRDTIAAYFPDARIEGNVIAGADARRYPDGNQYPNGNEFDAQFVDAAKGDYRVAARARGAGNAAASGPGADVGRLPSP